MRSNSATMIAAAKGTGKTPYIRVVINSIDLSSRLLFLEHIEEPYRDRATLVFRNDDRYFDNTTTVDLLGYSFQPGYGYTTGATPTAWAATTAYSIGDSVAPTTPDGYRYYCITAGTSGGSEPTWPTIGNTVADGTVTWEFGCASDNEYGMYPTLWVKNQQIVSSPGSVVCQLYCEGMWMQLREQRVMVSGGNMALVTDPANLAGNTPYLDDTFDATKTIYELIESTIESAFSWTLNASPAVDDGILNAFRPTFSINVPEFEMAARLLYRLISMTKCYLRQKANTTWEIVFPQDTDTVDETYYSASADGHPFFEYLEKINEVLPNRIVVFANNTDDNPDWPNVIVGDTGAYTGNYVEVLEPHLAPMITGQVDANNRAEAILVRLKAEGLAGRVVIPHDCRVEPYDRVAAYDERGT